MEKTHSRSIKLAALAAGALTLSVITAGCGQTEPPSTDQLRDNMHFFDLKDVKAANGEPVHCVEYGAGTWGTNSSKSWFGFACDFQGTAEFPNDPQQITTTTTAKPR